MDTSNNEMARSDVERDFPALAGVNCDLSDEDFNYNCLAYALGDQLNWWEPPNGRGKYWPPGFPPDTRVETVESILRLHGFTVEVQLSDTPQAEAVAIYAEGSEWTHFARFSAGSWSSKLGEGHDVSEITLAHLEGAYYGKVIKILQRPKEDLK